MNRCLKFLGSSLFHFLFQTYLLRGALICLENTLQEPVYIPVGNINMPYNLAGNGCFIHIPIFQNIWNFSYFGVKKVFLLFTYFSISNISSEIML